MIELSLERKVAQRWLAESAELAQHADLLQRRAERKEAEAVAGLSLDAAALHLIQGRDGSPSYFDLFAVLRHGQAAHMNIVQFYYAMRRSLLVRMNGTHVIRRRSAIAKG